MTFSPPPWSDVAHLLLFGCYFYFAFFLLAATFSYSYAIPMYIQPTLDYVFNGLDTRLQHSWFKKKVEGTFLSRISRGFAFGVMRMLVSTIICIMYVYSTYAGYINPSLLICQKCVAVVLFFNIFCKLVYATRPVSFVLGFEAIMDIFSLASLLMAKRTHWLNFSFLQAYVILSRYFQIEPTLEIYFMVKSSPFHRQLTRLALEFVVFIYVFASGLQLFEQLGEPWEPLIGTTFDLTLANSFYFTVVTIFTVGYGDFVPFTLLGRLWIIFIIVFGAYLVSRKIGQVVDVVSGLRRGLGSFVKTEGTDHCVICGNVKWEYLKAFVLEFYGDDRNAKTKLVIICDQPNWSETVWINFFTSNIQYRDNVTYLEGSCVTRDDLIRAQVETSKAVFILNNQHNPDPYAEDSETLKRILTIRSYTPNLPIYSMCALRDSMLQITFALEQVDEHDEAEEVTSRRVSGMNLRSQMMDPSSSDMAAFSSLADELNPHMGDFEDEDDDDDGLLVTSYDGSSDLKSEALCMQEIEMSLLAKNVFCNGLSTLLANLILRVTPMLKDEDPIWAWEYKLGTECRFEYVKLPMQLTNRKFAEIALIMYDYGVIPVATKRFMDKKWRAVTPETNVNLNSIALIITFHSSEYLDTVMAAIASCVTERYSDTASVSSDVPFLDEEDRIPRNDRCERAGAILTGDLTVEYQYVDDSDNEDGPETQELSSTQSGEGETPSVSRIEEISERFAPPTTNTPGTALRLTPPETGLPFEANSSSLGPSRAMPFVTNSDAHRVIDPIPVLINPITQGRGGAPSSSIPEQMKSQDKLPLVITRTGSGQHLPSMSGGPLSADGIPRDPEQRRISRPRDKNVPRGEGVTKSSGFRTFVSSPETAGSSQDHRTRRLADLKTAVQSNSDTHSIPVVAASSSDGRGRPVEKELVGEDARRAPSRQKRHHVSFENQGHGNPRKPRKGQVGKPRSQSGKPENEESVIMFHGDQELPMKLTGHIVVCTIGRMALQNLGYFLQQVNIERSFSKGKAPVVAICSRLSEEEEADLKVYASNSGVRESDKRRSPTERNHSNSAESEPHQPSLVVIQGNSLSVKTLRRAQFEKAKAVVILACEDVNDIDHMDAKAIFTVMTLDYLLGEDSETFVCSMLDAEESMQLLRAPARPRRRGAVLGRIPEENVELAVTASHTERGRRRQSPKNRLGRFNSNFKNRRDSTQRFPSRTLSYGAITASGRVSRSVSFMGDRSFAAAPGVYRNIAHGLSQNSFSAREPSVTSFGALQRVRDGDDGALIQSHSLAGDSAFRILLGPSANNGLASTDTLRDDKGRRRAMNGLRHGFRDESFEKQRYASGEMVISSTYMSLLIREFAMPGLIAVVRKIFGATIGKQTKARRSWIRTVSIPAKWIGEGQRTYREVFEVLIGYGAIALGLYRSGNANVRVQFVAGSDCNTSSLYSSRSSSFGTLPRPNISGSSDGSLERDFAIHRGELSADIPETANDVLPQDGVEGRNGGNERSGLLGTRARQRSGGYGAIGTQDRFVIDSTSGNSGSGSGEDGEVEDGIHIPPELYRMAESVVSGQAVSSEWSSEGYGNDAHHKYTCPSSRRTTIYRELPGGDNVLPYVYTNPEAFTLVSERDAVYVLVSPNVQLPEEW